MTNDIHFCCEEMKQNIAEQIIYFNEVFDEYGITLTEDNVSFILLKYCPWCGSLLPESKRLIWFEQLEEINGFHFINN